jgi:hypothetical protein
MPGPLPSQANARRRRNRSPSLRILHQLEGPADVPPLPFEVTERTAAWWESLWSSPMAAEWLPSDVHGLAMLAKLVDGYWSTDDARVRLALAGEIRLQGRCWGLSPQDRRRLEWSIAHATTADRPVR